MSAEARLIFSQVKNTWTLACSRDLATYCEEDPERHLPKHKAQAEEWAVKILEKLGLQAPKGRALAKILQAAAEVERSEADSDH